MTADLRCEVELIGTRLVVGLIGELCLQTAPKVRLALLKGLVEQPDAILVDLTGLTISEPTAVTVFSAVARQAAIWPGTPLLLCAPGSDVAAALARFPSRLPVYPSIEAALAVEPRQQAAVSDMLLPVSGAGRRAREVAVDACARWDVPHLCVPAGLVAAELVADAAARASTMLNLRLTLGRRYLTVAVRDGSISIPKLVAPAPQTDDPAAERGLLLVDAVAHRWGSILTGGGKVVWATLRIRSPTAG
ncbi:STAS domain-containing protein [Actinoplanes sp. NPDC026623]|uniref:STAS domain-containing protein n=1 Tax=Actinoplanes sp. NPDC026623 TaxID=3155610 RepID=UPI00340508F7